MVARVTWTFLALCERWALYSDTKETGTCHLSQCPLCASVSVFSPWKVCVIFFGEMPQ